MAAFPEALPHGELTRVAERVHSVRGAFKMGPGVVIGRTMAVLESDDGLVILNATRLSPEGEAALDRLGPVKHVVKLADSHFVDEPYYLDRYGATLWSLPGADLREMTAGRTLGPEGPVKGGTVIDYGELAGWREAGYLVPLGGGTLVTCDAIQNQCDTEGSNFMGRLTSSLMGFKGGVINPPMWRRFQKCKGPDLARALSGLVELEFENLVTGHGPPVSGGAAEQVRRAIQQATA